MGGTIMALFPGILEILFAVAGAPLLVRRAGLFARGLFAGLRDPRPREPAPPGARGGSAFSSPRGSNMLAIAAACRDGRIEAEIRVVVSNLAGAPG